MYTAYIGSMHRFLGSGPCSFIPEPTYGINCSGGDVKLFNMPSTLWAVVFTASSSLLSYYSGIPESSDGKFLG